MAELVTSWLLLVSDIEDLFLRRLLVNTSFWGKAACFLSPLLALALMIGIGTASDWSGAIALAYISIKTIKWSQSRTTFMLETHYEAVASVMLVAVALGHRGDAILISSCVFISSISAGYCKWKSSLWSFTGGSGFARFIQMPWCTRRLICQRTWIAKKTRPVMFRKVTTFVTGCTPYYQMITGALCLILALRMNWGIDGSTSLGLSILAVGCFQIIFAFLLWLICGLGRIPLIYGLLVWVGLTGPTWDILVTGSYVDESASIMGWIFLLLYLVSCIKGLCLKRMRFQALFPFLPHGPFHMFTEENTNNILITTACSMQTNLDTNTIQQAFFGLDRPFRGDGTRAWSQDITTKIFSLYYPMMDFYRLNAVALEGGVDMKRFMSPFHRRLVIAYTQHYASVPLAIYSYVWDDITLSYRRQLYNIASCTDGELTIREGWPVS